MRSDEDSVRSIGSLANLVTASGRCRASGHQIRQRDGVKSCEVDQEVEDRVRRVIAVIAERSTQSWWGGGLWQVFRPFFCRVRVSPTEDSRLLSTAGSHLRRIKLTLN